MQTCRTGSMQTCRHADLKVHALRTLARLHAAMHARPHVRTLARPHARMPARPHSCSPVRPHACTPTRPPTCAPARPPARMFPSCPIGKALKYAYMPAYNYAWFYISFFVVNAFISEQRFAKWLCIPSYLLSQGPVEVQPRPG